MSATIYTISSTVRYHERWRDAQSDGYMDDWQARTVEHLRHHKNNPTFMEDNIHTDNATTIHANSLTHSPTKRMCLSQTKNSFKITKYSVELQRNETNIV